MNDGGIVRLEDQQRSAFGFRAVHHEVVETNAPGHACQRRMMTAREAEIEGMHEGLFLETLAGTPGHSRVEVPDVPAICDRHVTGVGPAVHEDHAVFAEQAVVAGIVDVPRNKELFFLALIEIARHRLTIIYFGKTDAGM